MLAFWFFLGASSIGSKQRVISVLTPQLAFLYHASICFFLALIRTHKRKANLFKSLTAKKSIIKNPTRLNMLDVSMQLFAPKPIRSCIVTS